MGSIIMPEKIKFARESRGYSQQELGKLLNVSKQYICLIEQGKNEPNSQIVFDLLRCLNFPLSFYKLPLPITDDNSPTFFRSKKTTLNKMIKASENMVSIFMQNDNFFKNFVLFPEVCSDITQYSKSKSKYSFDEIEKIANSLRKLWHIGDKPIGNLTALLQQKGIIIININVNNRKIDAFSKISLEGVPYIFVDTQFQSAVRFRFDLAHELGHLILHRNYTKSDLLDTELNNTIEDEANYFASAFLLPKSSFSQDVYSSSINHFILLKKKWKVSISSMIYRCNYLNLLNSSQIKYLKDQMTYKKYWYHEPFDDSWCIDKPFLHKQIINALITNSILSPYDIEQELGLSASELEESYFLEPNTLCSNIEPNIIELNRINNHTLS